MSVQWNLFFLCETHFAQQNTTDDHQSAEKPGYAQIFTGKPTENGREDAFHSKMTAALPAGT